VTDIGRLFITCEGVGCGAGNPFVLKGVYRAILINYPSEEHKDDRIRAALGN
jgi:cyclase